ncbi:DUF2945 domain-containing protein [Agrobacterium sp. rho-13.3]|uniref:DUF2945 domain-containing protein n=1 Tax=Agrobacterium sp. rho-13.3 TaxID=3072980 RepID=UPI003D7BF927
MWERLEEQSRCPVISVLCKERKIEGSVIKRKASKDEPAYLIEQEDGGRVLKSHSELQELG